MKTLPEITIRVTAWPEAAPRTMPLREAVFVREQGVPPTLERDVHDAESSHAIAETADGTVIGTGRMLPDGRIGRLAVAAGWRGRGIGGQILEALIAEAQSCGFPEVFLHAQTQAESFYQRHGFIAEGAVFEEAGIAHRMMRRILRR